MHKTQLNATFVCSVQFKNDTLGGKKVQHY